MSEKSRSLAESDVCTTCRAKGKLDVFACETFVTNFAVSSSFTLTEHLLRATMSITRYSTTRAR